MKVFGWIVLIVGLFGGLLAVDTALGNSVDWGSSAIAVAIAAVGWIYAGIALIKQH